MRPRDDSRALRVLIVAAGLVALFALWHPHGALGWLLAVDDYVTPPLVEVRTVESTYQGLTAREWAARTVARVKERNELRREKRALRRQLVRLAKSLAFVAPWPWIAVADCETGDSDGRPPYRVRWDYNGPSGFDASVQFHPGTWRRHKLPAYPAYAYQATPFQQLVVAEITLSREGWKAWPACSRKVGLR